ncbi:LPS assembly lipoprotein LptE [Crenalkalicoccus roseus]|uniref:LPS assembly lipoprotein LptE n=1 Tax=Crenalkalicoccus roseus TaxID=1485588 RepID=UPI001080B506|nr:LPS assembly lipoprotein LptE [Crenalkalicoccus roseus]
MSRAASSTSSSDRRPRRALLGAAGLLALGGCGFRPLYGPAAAPEGPAELRAELAAVRVAPIGDRFGQLLRRDLQRRFEGSAPGTQARYLLTVGVGFDTEILGYRRDGTISRVRSIAIGNWTLATLSVPPQPVGRSAMPVRVMDAFNVPDLQFFAADTARDAMEQRLVGMLAHEIANGVALELRRHLARTAAEGRRAPA